MGFNFTNKHFTGATLSPTGAGFEETYILIVDQKSSGTDAGSFASASEWVTRDLNNIIVDDTGQVSLSSNQFTLPAGTYEISSRAPARGVREHVTRLQNITDGTTTLGGTLAYGHDTVSEESSSDSNLSGRFTIASSKVFEIQHRCLGTKADDGLGLAAGFNSVSIYTTVELFKV